MYKLFVVVAALAAANPIVEVTPCVTLTPADRQALTRGEVVSRTLPGGDYQVGLFAVARITAAPSVLVESTRNIADMKKSAFVSAVRRFSNPPQLSDLDELVLADRDLDALMDCTVGDCAFKLTAPEIGLLARVRAEAGGTRAALQPAFRRVLLDRVTTYLRGGLGAVPPVANRDGARALGATMAELHAQTPCVAQPALAEWLRSGVANGQQLETFLYWSQEFYRSGRPVILVTHVAMLQDGGHATVVGKQVFASRYMDGAIAMTAITTDPATGTRYLVYLNRSSVDLLGGFLGGLRRSIIESRLRGQVPDIIQRLRGRLERTRP